MGAVRTRGLVKGAEVFGGFFVCLVERGLAGAECGVEFAVVFHLLDEGFAPGLAGVAAPRGPGDATGRRVALLAGTKALALLIDFVAGEPGAHGAHGGGAKGVAAKDLRGAAGGDGGAACVTGGFPVAVTLRFLAHRFGGGGVHQSVAGVERRRLDRVGGGGVAVPGGAN